MAVPKPRLSPEQRTEANRQGQLRRSLRLLDRLETDGPRTLVELTTIQARRITHLRQALRDIKTALRPDHCMGCRIVREILNPLEP